MPTWEDIPPYTDKYTYSRQITCTNVLLFLNTAGFVLTGLLPRVFLHDISYLHFDARHAIGRLHLWQFATYPFIQFCELGCLFFFIFAGYALYTLGNELELEIGAPRFLILYFASAFYGALTHAVYQYAANSFAPAMTFFGPVAAVAIVSAMRYPSRPVLFFFVIPMRMMTCVLIMGVVLLFYCVVNFRAGLSPFSIVGAALAAVAMTKAEPALDRRMARAAGRRERDRFLEEIEVRREADRILEKISREGMGSLSRSEKKLLRRASEMANRPRNAR